MTTNSDLFVQLESAVWDALVRGDINADLHALSEDFLGVYPSGFATRADHAQQLESGPSIEHYAVLEPKVLTLADDCALLSYRASYQRVGHAQSEEMYVSSIWKYRAEEGWINVFSQDTPVADAETK